MKKLLTTFIITSLISGSLAACNTNSISSKNLATNITKSDIHIEMPQSENLEADILKFYNNLLIETWKNDSDNTKNIMISPLSIAAALSITSLGANGETLLQIEDAFGFSKDEMASFLSVYTKELPSSVNQANSIWIKDDPTLNVSNNFLATNNAYLQPSIYNSNFDSQTLTDINNWVHTNTNGMIDSVLNEISEDARLYIINALAFEGDWEKTYNDSQVFDRTFTNFDGYKSDVKLMNSSEHQYLEGNNFTGFSKPYKDDTFRFVGLLPNEGENPTDILTEIGENTEEFLNLLDASTGFVNLVSIPKFRQEFSAELSETLKLMGITSAFDDNLADFSNMATLYDDENLSISKVIHKTFIEVDETGTEAAAVTSVEIATNSSSNIILEEKYVILDRPFVYLIIDTNKNLPLFMGVINEL